MVAERTDLIRNYLGTVSEIISALPVDRIDDIMQTIRNAYDEGKHVLLCGNGGSASAASHFASDLQKGVASAGKKRFQALALTDALPIITAWANDTDYSNIFVEQVATWGNPGDLLIAISGSGNSPNVLRAVEKANELGMTTIGISGMGGGKLAGLVQKPLVVPTDNMQQIEDVHVVLAHLIMWCLCQEVRE